MCLCYPAAIVQYVPRFLNRFTHMGTQSEYHFTERSPVSVVGLVISGNSSLLVAWLVMSGMPSEKVENLSPYLECTGSPENDRMHSRPSPMKEKPNFSPDRRVMNRLTWCHVKPWSVLSLYPLFCHCQCVYSCSPCVSSSFTSLLHRVIRRKHRQFVCVTDRSGDRSDSVIPVTDKWGFLSRQMD